MLNSYHSNAPHRPYMRRVLKSWDSKTATWNSASGITTTEYGAANISAVGALDGNNWYAFDVSTMIRNIINKTATNYGWRLDDSTAERSNAVCNYCSSDYGYPYRPELVVNYTVPSTANYGNRPYESSTGSGQNCMGYALDINEYINNYILFSNAYATSTETAGINKCTNYAQLLAIVERLSLRYMNAKIGADNYEVLSSYNSAIKSNRYRVVLRVGVNDNNGEDGWQLYYLNNMPSGDDWDYHWRYQTSTGQWAEKIGDLSSHIVSGSSGTKDPGASSWSASVTYSSPCKYYSIRTK